MKSKRDYHSGSLFLPKGCKKWTIQYYRDGKRVREATGQTSRVRAQDELTKRLSAVNEGNWQPKKKRAVRIQELHDNLLAWYQLNKPKAVKQLGWRWGTQDEQEHWKGGHLGPVFAETCAANITAADLDRYALRRKEEGAQNGTINRELTALRRMYSLARKQGTLTLLPYFSLLPEADPRQGFVDDAQFDRLVAACDEPWMRVFLELGYTYGWRHGELLPLRVKQLNFARREIRLEAGTTKNKDGRTVAMTGRAFELLRGAVAGKGAEEQVLTRDNARTGKRKPVKDMRRAWGRLIKRAGLPGLLVHDLRRSAAKATRRAGISEKVAMEMGGWRTRSVFERYAITDSADQQMAAAAIEKTRAESRENSLKLALNTEESGLGKAKQLQ
jgi:integrase